MIFTLLQKTPKIRWVLDVELFSISIEEMADVADYEHVLRYVNCSLTKHFMIGQSHAYYDGPHCGFSLGFIHFNWSLGWCEKCMPKNKSESCLREII
jgi:hypothetical protein